MLEAVGLLEYSCGDEDKVEVGNSGKHLDKPLRYGDQLMEAGSEFVLMKIGLRSATTHCRSRVLQVG